MATQSMNITRENCTISFRREDTFGMMGQLPIWFHNGEYFIEGIPGKRYTIDVRNVLVIGRVEFVISVDGVDIQDGEDGSEYKHGLIIQSRSSHSFEGYRTSMSSVATFRFCSPDGSYSSLTGRPKNVGVIGIATYNEQNVLPSIPVSKPRDPWKLYDRATPYSFGDTEKGSIGDYVSSSVGGSLSSKRATQSLGTQYGEERHSAVGTTTFTRSTTYPVTRLAVRYESRETLMQLGIIVDGPTERTPNPFPASSPEPKKFVQPPPTEGTYY